MDNNIFSRNSISFQLLRNIFGLYCIIAIIVTALHLGHEYMKVQDRMEESFALYHNALEKTLTSEVWHLDYNQVQNTLSGIVQLPFIVGTSIHLPEKTVYARLGQVSLAEANLPLYESSPNASVKESDVSFVQNLYEYTFPLFDRHSSNPEAIAHVYFYSSDSIIFQQVSSLFWSILLASLLKTSVLWVIFLYFGQKTLGAPIKRLVTFIRNLPLEQLPDKDNADATGKDHNELELLDSTLHSMSTQLSETLDKLKEEIREHNLLNIELEKRVGERTRELAASNQEISENREKLQNALKQVSGLITSVSQLSNFNVRFINPGLKSCYEEKNCVKTTCPCYGKEKMRCWQIAGTYCGEKVQGEYAQKYDSCSECDIYKHATSDPIYEIGEQFNNMMHVLEQKNKKLQKAEQETRESEERFRAVAETANDAIISTDHEGHVTLWNRGAEKIFGHSSEEMIGKFVTSIMHERYRSAHTMGLKAFALTGKSRLLGKTVEVTGLRKNGEEFPLEISLSSWHSSGNIYFTAVIRDITERKNADEKLQKSEKKFKALTALAPVGIYMTDNKGECIYVNERWTAMAGISSEDAMGKGWINGIHREDREMVFSMWNKMIESEGQWNLEYRFQDCLGNIVWVLGLAKTVLDDAGQVTGFIGVNMDISERIKAEEELKRTQGTILQQEKMASIGQLAAGVAHEINNPMGFISSNLSSLGNYTDKMIAYINAQDSAVAALNSAKTDEQIRAIRKKFKLDYIIEDIGNLIEESRDGSERVKKIVQNLKSFSRVDQADHKDADINECIESTLNIVMNEIKYKATVEKNYGKIPLITCFPQQLNQAFMNLLVNGAQAIEKQGEITIQTWNGNGIVNISISDTGSGIPREKIDRIFEPFFTTKPVGSGTGLGLSITYDIIKKHHGTIDVTSEVGKGTTFTIQLPVSPDLALQDES